MVVLGALGDDAGDAAGLVLFQLGQAGLEVDAVAQLFNVLLQQLVAGHAAAAVVGVLDLGVHVIGVVLCVLGRPLGLVAAGVDHVHTVLVGHDLAHKVDHLAGLVDPGLDDALVALAGSVAGDLAQQLGAVHLDAVLHRAEAVHGAHPVAGVLHVGVLLDDAEVQAVLGGESSGEHTAVAGTDDDNVGVHGLGDGSLVNVGLGAQPVVCVAGGQLHAGDHSLALSLCVAALGGLHDSVGGDGGAGHAVDLGRTGSQQLLAQLVGSGSAEGSGLAGGIDHDIGDSALGEGHGDLDSGADALGGALVGAGDVGAGSAGSGGGGRTGGGIAGSQGAGGHTAHGGSSGDLQKALAGDLVHDFSLFLFFFVCRDPSSQTSTIFCRAEKDYNAKQRCLQFIFLIL